MIAMPGTLSAAHDDGDRVSGSDIRTCPPRRMVASMPGPAGVKMSGRHDLTSVRKSPRSADAFGRWQRVVHTINWLYRTAEHNMLCRFDTTAGDAFGSLKDFLERTMRRPRLQPPRALVIFFALYTRWCRQAGGARVSAMLESAAIRPAPCRRLHGMQMPINARGQNLMSSVRVGFDAGAVKR